MTTTAGAPATRTPLTVEQRGPELLASWIADGYAYVVVGELDDSAAQDIARRVAAQIRS